jgi:hypothetical protein
LLAHGRRRTALGAAIAVTTIAGCTSADSKNDYVDAVNDIQSTAIATYNQTVNSTAGNQQAQLENAAGTIDGIIADLNALEVPEEADAGHRALVAGFRELEDAFADAADRVEDADTNETFAAMERLVRQGEAIAAQLDDALEQLRSDLDVG